MLASFQPSIPSSSLVSASSIRSVEVRPSCPGELPVSHERMVLMVVW